MVGTEPRAEHRHGRGTEGTQGPKHNGGPAGGQPEGSGEVGQETGETFGCSPNVISCAVLFNKQVTWEGLDPKANMLSIRGTF